MKRDGLKRIFLESRGKSDKRTGMSSRIFGARSPAYQTNQ
ncbi:unnamed protein product [Coffea canephora]|uniref:Uncharacterized protein n=1 Tax=Coffea canephora TaxID=49390 RepID=A0A068VCJ4_COFCA|nr:unnamed protein product [Coffea canephora]